MQRQGGFTLIEIAIVFVVIGLMLGGILKGVELISDAKSDSIVGKHSAIRISWHNFIDRYGSPPGDFAAAEDYFEAGTPPGNGDGIVQLEEATLSLRHMTHAGFLECGPCTAGALDAKPSARNSLTNDYGGVMSLWTDDVYYITQSASASGRALRIQIHSGANIPSDVLSVIDFKTDDGYANGGEFVFNSYDPQAPEGVTDRVSVKECVSIGDNAGVRDTELIQGWRSPTLDPPVWENCGAGVLL